MSLYAFAHALAVGSLWMIGAVVALMVYAEVWGWLTRRDSAEFWRRREPDEMYRHAPHYNRRVESHLRIVRGEYPPQTEGWESEAFALDAGTRPAA